MHLLKFHFPYHESDHVLTFAYNALCDGTCLQDLELRRHDEVFLDALGARRIPDPTTAGDFCRRFDEASIRLLQDVVHEVRRGVWAEQPDAFFDQAVIDMDGFLVETTGQCKQGMDIAYDGTWGYHALVLTLANTGEVLGLVNRRATAPRTRARPPRWTGPWRSASGAASAGSCCAATPTSRRREHLDRWDADGRVRFVFGYDAAPNLVARAGEIAGEMPGGRCSGRRATRCRRDRASGRTTSRRPSSCRREFENIRLQSEEVAEFNYRPTACRKTYRMVVVRKNMSVEKGERVLFDDIRYFFYITNDWVSEADEIVFCGQRPLPPGEPAGPVARRGAGVACAGGQPGEQLGVHGDDGVGVGPEGVVGAAAAGAAGTLAGEASGREALGVGPGVQDLREGVRAAAVSDRPDGPAAGVSVAGVEPAPADLLPVGRSAALAERGHIEVGVRMRRSAAAPSATPQEGRRTIPKPTTRGNRPALGGAEQRRFAFYWKARERVPTLATSLV